MKTIVMTLALLAGLPLAASAQVTKEDIKKLTAAGISDDVILSYVRANGGVARLSADDVVELKQAGASEKLLTTVLTSAPAAPVQEPRTNMVERQRGTAPAPTTYVYDSTPYYYSPASEYYSSSYYPTYSYSSPYYSSYYPRPYYYSSCYPRSYYWPSVSFGFSSGYHCSSSSRARIGVGGYIRR